MRAALNSTAAFYQRSLAEMTRLRSETEDLQRQISTGNRLARASDDPVAAARLRTLDRADRIAAIDQENAALVSNDLQLAANEMELIASGLIRARELATLASTGTISDEQRALIAQELDTLRQSILTSANTLGTRGEPLFAGENSDAAYTTLPDGSITYVGTASSGDLSLGQGQSVPRGVTGPEFLEFDDGGTTTDAFAVLATLSTALQGVSGDPATAASAAIGSLENALDSLTKGQTITGARIAWVDSIQGRQLAQAESHAAETNDIGGTDLATAIAELQLTLTALEATQASFARVSSLSLFNAI